jgi:two-component system alkaline phosphatase synthesis response regulator PhoP
MPKKILVVDDTTDTRDLLHFYLSNAGFDVIIAADGGEGLYRAKADKPDLIITDITMPNLDGHQMIKQLRDEAEFAGVPIIVMSAYGKDFINKALEHGATDTIEKPMNLDILVEKVKTLTGESNVS